MSANHTVLNRPAASFKNAYGQYFTPDTVAAFMLDVAGADLSARVLEPCSGEGVFLRVLQERGFADVTACEIDPKLATGRDFVRCESFVSAEFDHEFDLIIGNPPYIRWANLEKELKDELANSELWQKYCNSLCDYLSIFLLKSVRLLADGGALVFICPEYWFSTTHAQPMRDFMLAHGHFEEIYYFSETPIFSQVSISTVIFRYRKCQFGIKPDTIAVAKYNSRQKLTAESLAALRFHQALPEVEYLTVPQFKPRERWVLVEEAVQHTFRQFEAKCVLKTAGREEIQLFTESNKPKQATVGDVCDIGNGLVSGLDRVFQVSGALLKDDEKAHTLNVVKAKDLRQFFFEQATPYIFLPEGLNDTDLREHFPNVYAHLQPHKSTLDARYRYNRDIPYWEWVFPRNLALFRRTEPRIFVPCKERISHKEYFRFALAEAGLYPTQDVTALLRKPTTRESIEYITAFLNNKRVFNWLRYNGIIKGNIVEFSEKPLASIPFRMIDWADSTETQLHDEITALCKEYIRTKQKSALQGIEERFDQLFME